MTTRSAGLFLRRRFDRMCSHLPRSTARWGRLFFLGSIVGLLGGTAAAAMHWGLAHGVRLLVGRFTHVGGADVGHFQFGVLLLPAVGGLASGLIVWWLCREAPGHGTNALIRAFHCDLGALPLRGPLVKAVAAVGVISCGGSAGPEGPVAGLGASIGSSIGRLFGLTPRERRVMLVAGCAAGVGAIFQCPLGGALFAAGVLYREPEFESDAIVPAFVASVIAYTTYMVFHGFGEPLLADVGQLVFHRAVDLVPYAALGPMCAALSIFFALSLRTVERWNERLSWPIWLTPAIGGLLTGALACVLPQIMDGQYEFIANALSGRLFENAEAMHWWRWAALFLAVAVFKCVATALTVGGGASGGVLGPSVFIGGAVGASLGAALVAMWPGVFTEELRQSLIPVGMAGVLAASMRTPMAAIVMTTEMTGSYGLIVPLMLVCSSAYVLGRRHGLNDEQVRGTAESPAHAADAIVHVLESLRVADIAERAWPMVATPEMTLTELVKRVRPGTRPVFAVLREGRIVGLISVPDIERVMETPMLADALIAEDIMTTDLAVVDEQDDLYRALNVFRIENHDVLPVITRENGQRWVGMLTRERVYDVLQRHISETQQAVVREHVGLAAVGQEGQLRQLVMGVSPIRTDLIQRLMVPLEAVGKSIREVDFRKRFGAQIVAIEQPDGEIQCPPELDVPLKPSQRLVAVVRRDNVVPEQVSEAAPGRQAEVGATGTEDPGIDRPDRVV